MKAKSTTTQNQIITEKMDLTKVMSQREFCEKDQGGLNR